MRVDCGRRFVRRRGPPGRRTTLRDGRWFAPGKRSSRRNREGQRACGAEIISRLRNVMRAGSYPWEFMLDNPRLVRSGWPWAVWWCQMPGSLESVFDRE